MAFNDLGNNSSKTTEELQNENIRLENQNLKNKLDNSWQDTWLKGGALAVGVANTALNYKNYKANKEFMGAQKDNLSKQTELLQKRYDDKKAFKSTMSKAFS